MGFVWEILDLFGKKGTLVDLEERIINLETQYDLYEIFESINTNSGRVTIPAEAEIITDKYPEGVDAICVKLDSQGKPLDEIARQADGTPITTTFNINGDYVLSGTPANYPVGIVYFIKIYTKYASNVPLDIRVQKFELYDASEVQYNNTTVELELNRIGGIINKYYLPILNTNSGTIEEVIHKKGLHPRVAIYIKEGTNYEPLFCDIVINEIGDVSWSTKKNITGKIIIA